MRILPRLCLLPVLLGLATLSLQAESPELLAILEEAGFRPKADEEGELVAIYQFAPAGKVTPELWAVLEATPTLTTINGSKMNGPDLREVAKIHSLEHLVIGGGGEAQPADYATLAALPNLKHLNLHHLRDFTGVGAFVYFDESPLEQLTIHNCRPFDPQVVEEIARIPKLCELELTALQIGIEDLAPLEGHASLASLTLPVDAKSMPAFLELTGSLPALTELQVLCPIREEGFVRLSPEQFAMLNALHGLRKLRTVNLGLTQAQVDALKAEHPELELDLRAKTEMHEKSEPMEPLDSKDSPEASNGV